MADKQSVINLAWNLDTSNFDRAKNMTDNLKQSFENLRSPLMGANEAIGTMHDNLGSIKDGYRGIGDMAKNVYNNNRGITDTLRVMHDNSRTVINDYQSINTKATDLTSTYKDVLATSAKLTESTQKTVIATQQLRQSLLDLQKVKPVAPSVPYERTSSRSSSVVSGTEKDHSLRNTVIGGGIAGIVGNGISMLSNYVSTSAKSAFEIARNAQQSQLAWETMGVKSQKSIAGLTGEVGKLRSQANISGAEVTQTERNLYNATNGNIDKTKALTDAMFAYGKASNQTDQQIEQASGSMGRLFNSSKVRGTAFTRIAKQMPAMRNAIIQASGESASKFMADMNAGKVSGQELEDLMVKSAQNSGQAWQRYGQTAQGALAKLQGSTSSIWLATMKGIAGQTNSGLVQLSNLVSQNIKPISKMMIGVGNAGAKMVGSVISFLVKNQKPIGSIAHSLIDIVGTIGKSVWTAFSGVIQAIGSAFGVLTGNSKKSNNPIQTTANLLKDVASHKKAIEAITYAFTGMFMVKKATQFAGALKQVAVATGMIGDAESNSKGGLLNSLLSNGTLTGRSLKGKTPQKFGSVFKKQPTSKFSFAETAGKDLSNASLSSGFADRTNQSLLSQGSTKLASLGSKLASFSSDSKLLTGVKSIASKIPLLDVAMAGTQLIGMNRKNAGSKIGSAGGMLAGTAGGAALGTAILPGVGTAIGGAIGGIAGTSLGKKIGSFVQSHIPKHLFSDIGKQWNGLVDTVSHSSFGKSVGKTFNSMKDSAGKAFQPISKSWHSLTISLGNDWKPIHKELSGFGNWIGKQFAPIGKWFNSVGKQAKPVVSWLSNQFKKVLPGSLNFLGKVFSSTFSGLGKVVSTSFKIIGSVLSGAFKSIKGVFEVFSGILTGNWSKTWNGMKDIFSGVWNAISNTFKDIFGGIVNSISGFFGKVGHFIAHPIQSIKNGLHFANGTNSRYPHGLKQDTHAIINDGNGREIVRYPNGMMIRPNGTNVHMMLPKGSHVFNSNETSQIMNAKPSIHFASGTGFESKRSNINSTIHVKFDGLNMKSALITTRKYTNQVIGLIKRSYAGINRSSSTALRKMVAQSSTLWKTNNRNMQKELTVMSKQTTSVWKNIDRDTAKQQKSINNTADKFSKVLTKSLTNGANDMNKQLDKIWTSITSDFKSIFAQLGPYAHAGMNGAVDQLNSGISGIDKALGQFGGNNSVLSPIHYAEGTDAVSHTHLAMVNDAKSGFQDEAILSPNGGVRYAYGRNALTVLHKGESVLNGADTHEAISKGYIPRHASGVGSKKALRKLASQNASDYIGAFNSEFTDNARMTGSALQQGIIGAGRNASANEQNGYNWSHAMWSVIHNAMSSLGGSATGLLKAVEKAGTGKKYVWGATGPSAFDCSGLVQYALKQMGIDYPRTSGEQIAKAQHITRDQAQPGDLIGNSEHIGVVADNGAHHYFSAFNPSMHPNILMTPVNGSYFPGVPQFGRVGGISHKQSSNGIKGVSLKMQKLVKSQLGSHALSWLSKTFGDSVGASGNPAGDGVQRWKPDVVKALRALGLSTSGSMIDRVLRQINTESSGNPNAIGGTDGLNDGRAMGLMQVKPGTFSAYGKASLGGWNNGMASIYAGLNYAKHRYGPSLSFLGNGHGYAKGGRPPLHQPVLVGENGPEIAEFEHPVRIHSNAESRRMAGGFGRVNVNPNITINIKGSASKEDAKQSAKNVKQAMLQVLAQVFSDAEIEQAFNS